MTRRQWWQCLGIAVGAIVLSTALAFGQSDPDVRNIEATITSITDPDTGNTRHIYDLEFQWRSTGDVTIETWVQWYSQGVFQGSEPLFDPPPAPPSEQWTDFDDKTESEQYQTGYTSVAYVKITNNVTGEDRIRNAIVQVPQQANLFTAEAEANNKKLISEAWIELAQDAQIECAKRLRKQGIDPGSNQNYVYASDKLKRAEAANSLGDEAYENEFYGLATDYYETAIGDARKAHFVFSVTWPGDPDDP